MRREIHLDELLDGPLDDPGALVGNLRDLARINRWLGGVRLSAAGLAALAPGPGARTLLDVGTGGADIPLALLDRARRSGQRLIVTGIDSRPEVLAAAALVAPRLTATPELVLQVGDGRSLPYADRSFDVVHASLVVHHLEPDGAVALLREMGRVAAVGVVINDLVRGRLGWLGAWLIGHLLTRNRYTRHDAPLSVRRAYTVPELTTLLETAGLRLEWSMTGLLGHRVALVARIAPRSNGDGA